MSRKDAEQMFLMFSRSLAEIDTDLYQLNSHFSLCTLLQNYFVQRTGRDFMVMGKVNPLPQPQGLNLNWSKAIMQINFPLPGLD